MLTLQRYFGIKLDLHSPYVSKIFVISYLECMLTIQLKITQISVKMPNETVIFWKSPFGKCGVPSEVLLIFRSERNFGNSCTILPGPISCMRNRVVKEGKYGWCVYLENRLPFYNDHPNRNFPSNSKHPSRPNVPS